MRTASRPPAAASETSYNCRAKSKLIHKNTRCWQPQWLDKLKAERRALGAALAVIVTAALPEGVVEFGLVDGVWVAGLRAWPALAAALREQLVAVGFARAAAEGRDDKMAVLYRYLAGDEFRGRIEALVEAFTALRFALGRERAAMERIRKEREKQLERLMYNTGGLYGEVRGIIGNGLVPLAALDLEAALLEDGSEE